MPKCYYCHYRSILHSAVLCSQADSLCSCHMRFSMSNCILFTLQFLTSTELEYWQRCLVAARLVLHETAAVLAQVLRPPYIHAPVYSVMSKETKHYTDQTLQPPKETKTSHWLASPVSMPDPIRIWSGLAQKPWPEAGQMILAHQLASGPVPSGQNLT